MYLEDLAELALGLILVFIIMSLAVMQIQEVLAGWLRWRSNQLEKAIRSMLTDQKKQRRLRETFAVWYRCTKYLPDMSGLDLPPNSPIEKLGEKMGLWWKFRRVGQFPSFVDKLYEHPLLHSLAQPGKKPSYIPADKFTLALFDTIMTAGTDASTIQKALEDLDKRKAIILTAKLQDLLEDPHVKRWIDALIARAKRAAGQKDNYLELTRLVEEFDRFTCLYPDLKPVLNALLQSELPREDIEVYQRLEASSRALVVDYPELRQILDSLFRQAQTYTGVDVKARILDELKAKVGNRLEARERDARQKVVGLIEKTSAEVKQAEAQIAQVRTDVEKWFDDSMDRASG